MTEPGEHLALRTLEPGAHGRTMDPLPEECLDCGAKLSGPFCSHCGQKATDLDLTLREIFRDALADVLSFDSRIWRTLRRLLAQPGELTLDYWAGKRMRYVPPLRLYLFVSFLGFLVLMPLTRLREAQEGTSRVGMIRINGAAPAEMDYDARLEMANQIEEGASDSAAWVQLLTHRLVRPIILEPRLADQLLNQRLPFMLFLMVPVYGFYLRLLFRKKQKLFVPHFVQSLHLHTMAFILLIVGSALDVLVRAQLPSLICVVAILTSQFLALRRTYENGRIKTLLKLAIVNTLHVFTLALAMIVTFLLVAVSLPEV